MIDATEPKKTKERSPSFPFISLGRALERARQFYAEEKRGIAPYSRAVLHWKYSEASSGALQTVSALKSYRLLNEPPKSGTQRQLQLSDLALRILLDQREDSTEKLDLLRQAALNPPLAEEVYSKWDGLPSEGTLHHFLVLEKKFNESTARAVIRILQENQGVARLEQLRRNSDISETSSDEENISNSEDRSVRISEPQLKVPQLLIKTQKPVAHMEQLLSLDGSITTTMQFSDMPTASVYRWIAVYANLKAAELEKREAAEAAKSHGSAA